MIVTKTSINTVCMHAVIVGLTIAPLLKSCFSVAELLTAHSTGSALAFV